MLPSVVILEFVERRRKKLEEYLRVAFRDLKAIPKPLAYFLGEEFLSNS